MLDAEPGKQVEIKRIPVTSGKSLIRKKIEEASSAEKWLLENQNCLIELTISTEEFLKSEDRKKIFSAHQGIIYLIPKVKNNQMEDSPASEINLNQNQIGRAHV